MFQLETNFSQKNSETEYFLKCRYKNSILGVGPVGACIVPVVAGPSRP